MCGGIRECGLERSVKQKDEKYSKYEMKEKKVFKRNGENGRINGLLEERTTNLLRT